MNMAKITIDLDKAAQAAAALQDPERNLEAAKSSFGKLGKAINGSTLRTMREHWESEENTELRQRLEAADTLTGGFIGRGFGVLQGLLGPAFREMEQAKPTPAPTNKPPSPRR